MKRKTADNTYWKEFSGGYRMMLTSWNSIADAKSFSWDLIIMDELDEAPYELANQGDPEHLFSMRGITARNLKIFKLSTPTTTQGRIYKNFLAGDQRYYNCQCPICGELQVLTMMYGGRDYGLFGRSEVKDNITQIIPESVRYICKFCKKEIYEYQKQDMLNGGKWIPTARPINPAYRSYHISNLMSPIAFFSWVKVMQNFCETDFGQKITSFKSFIINILGEAWEARTEKRSYIDLYNKAEDYPLGILPEGALIVTMGTDVQKMYLQYTVVAWGRDMQSWVIDEGKFHAINGTKDKNDRCWQDWRNFILTKKYRLKKCETVEVIISRVAIDSGYNPDSEKIDGTDITYEHTVYEMVARTPRTIACRGNWKLKDTILKEERVKRQSPLKVRYDHAVNELKDEIFVKIDLPAGAPGEMHFTKQLGEEFFRGFLSEVYAETEPGKWSYRKIYERNEPLDTWILARAAAEHLNLSSWTEQIWNDVEMRLLK
jgi:phage terminase large subunit GpA-like protein